MSKDTEDYDLPPCIDDSEVLVNPIPLRRVNNKKAMKPKDKEAPKVKPTGTLTADKKPVSSAGQRRNPSRQVSSSQTEQTTKPPMKQVSEPEPRSRSINTPRPTRQPEESDDDVVMLPNPVKNGTSRSSQAAGTVKQPPPVESVTSKASSQLPARSQPSSSWKASTSKRSNSQESLQKAKRVKQETTEALKYHSVPCIPCIKMWETNPKWLCQMGKSGSLPCANCPDPKSCSKPEDPIEHIRSDCRDLHTMAHKVRIGHYIDQYDWDEKLLSVLLAVNPEYLRNRLISTIELVEENREGFMAEIDDLENKLKEQTDRGNRLEEELRELRSDVDTLLKRDKERSRVAEEVTANDKEDDGGEDQADEVGEQDADGAVGESENTNDAEDDDGDDNYEEE